MLLGWSGSSIYHLRVKYGLVWIPANFRIILYFVASYWYFQSMRLVLKWAIIRPSRWLSEFVNVKLCMPAGQRSTHTNIIHVRQSVKWVYFSAFFYNSSCIKYRETCRQSLKNLGALCTKKVLRRRSENTEGLNYIDKNLVNMGCIGGHWWCCRMCRSLLLYRCLWN